MKSTKIKLQTGNRGSWKPLSNFSEYVTTEYSTSQQRLLAALGEGKQTRNCRRCVVWLMRSDAGSGFAQIGAVREVIPKSLVDAYL